MDPRSITMWVAGPAALVVAKTHKIIERRDDRDRLRDKDALDLFRLLRAVPTADVVHGLRMLGASHLAAGVTTTAVEGLARLFATNQSEGIRMLLRAAGADEHQEPVIATSMIVLVGDILDAVG